MRATSRRYSDERGHERFAVTYDGPVEQIVNHREHCVAFVRLDLNRRWAALVHEELAEAE